MNNLTKEQERIYHLERTITAFKEYDEKRKTYVQNLKTEIENLKAKLEKKDEQLIRLNDDFEEYLDAHECAPGTILSPKQKATYMELSNRVSNLKKEIKKLRTALDVELQKQQSYKATVTEVLQSEDPTEPVLRKKLQEKSVAVRQLRKERKLMFDILGRHGLTDEYYKLKEETV